ncbi:hypothetical protein AAU61_02285 [Desulfocarbo indianensis]|nr:hypothetical protein AAU61_02285 [Desulfocarbo indianensis]
MAWLNSALLAISAAAGLAAVFFLAAYWRHRHAYLGLWSACWGAQAVLAALLLLQSLAGPEAVRRLALYALALAGAWLLARGAYEYAGRKLPAFWALGCAGAWLLEAAGLVAGWAAFAAVVILHGAAGWALWRHSSIAGGPSRWAACCLVLWALFRVEEPVFLYPAWLAPWGYLLAGVLSLGSALSLLTLFFEGLSTELKDMQTELQKSSDTLTAILNTTPVCIALLKDRRIKWVNPAAVDILGFSLEELHDLPSEKIYAGKGEWRRSGDELYGQIARQGRGAIEARYRHKDGHELICHAQGGPLNPQDLSQGFIFTMVDISDRKRVERQLARHQDNLEKTIAQRTSQLERVNQELRREMAERERVSERLLQSENLFRAVAETAASAIFIVQGEHLRYLNPAGERVLGRTLEELPRTPFKEIIHPDHRDMVLARSLARQKGLEAPRRYEFKIITTDGAVRWLDTAASYMEYQGRPAALGVAFDVTQRKQAEAELIREKERFQILAEQAPLGISLLGADGNYKYLNRKFRETFGYDINDIPTGRDWFDLAFATPQARREAMNAWLNDLKVYEVGESRPRVYEVRCKDGTKKVVNFRPVSMANGDHLIFYEDMTEQKKLEAQLSHAQKMEAVGTLSGGVAHEFNNILMAMRGYLQLLALEDGLTAKSRERLAKVEAGTQRAAELTQKMLTFSRLDSGERSPVDVNVAVQTVYGFLKQTLNRKIELSLDLLPDPPPIMANYSQLEQVILNLVMNARDAIGEKGLISIKTRLELENREMASRQPWAQGCPYLVVEVRDSGQGMTPEVAQRAFDPFFTTKEPGKGTGLGLSVAYSLAHNLGGEILVESSPQKGSAFTVYLPITPPETAVG